VKDLLERARREGTPLLEDQTATFVWQGPEALHLIGDFNAWDDAQAPTFEEAARQVWVHRLSLPPDAYIEYAYVRDGKRVPDPWNEHTTPSGMGQINHSFYMPQGAPTLLAGREPHAPRGTLTSHVVRNEVLVVDGRRTVDLYQPPTRDPSPLVVVLDGQDYQQRARLPAIVDNLIAQKRIRPVAMALVHSHATARIVEYGCSEATLGLLVERVVPLAQADLNLVRLDDAPGAYGVLGASMGGLMALYAGLRAPQVFGRVLSQSGAFTLQHETVVWDMVRHGPVRPVKIWVDVGRYEWLLDCNRRMHELLVERGYAVAYREHNAGHNYPAWRDEVWRGLEALFGTQAGSV
jgi:enterochelin esterase family protein